MLSIAAALAVGLETRAIVKGMIDQVLFSLEWGYVGLALAMLVTYPVLRRLPLVGFVLGTGWLTLFFGLLAPSFAYRHIQLWRTGQRTLDVDALARLPRGAPVAATLSGVWRYDLAARGTYRASKRLGGDQQGMCDVYVFGFCRVPIVSERWRPGDPVLAIGRCNPLFRGSGEPSKRDPIVEIWSADDRWADGQVDLTAGDAQGRKVNASRVFCSSAPDEVPDLAKAPFAFDRARGFLVLEKQDDAATTGRTALGLAAAYVLLVLGFGVVKLRRGRVLNRGELERLSALREQFDLEKITRDEDPADYAVDDALKREPDGTWQLACFYAETHQERRARQIFERIYRDDEAPRRADAIDRLAAIDPRWTWKEAESWVSGFAKSPTGRLLLEALVKAGGRYGEKAKERLRAIEG